MNINDASFKERASNSDIAEAETKESYEGAGYITIPLGFNQMHRRDEKGFSNAWMKIPRVLRNLPDMIIIKDTTQIIEIKGFYKVLKMKVNDFKSYVWWDRIFKLLGIPLLFNLYSLNSKKHYLVPFLNMNSLMEDAYRRGGKYKGNNEEYKEIDIKELERYCVR